MNRVPTRARKKSNLQILRARHLSRLGWLVHGFSTRVGGFSRAYGKSDLNLGFTKDDARATVERNRAVFLGEIGAFDRQKRRLSNRTNSFWPLITLRQIHSDIIHFVDSASDEPLIGDGMITATPGLLLAVQAADCLPVVLVDVKRRAVGVFHAGWRGTVKRIVEKGVGEMFRRFGSRPRDLKAAIGPGIQGCCYEVGEAVRTKFESQFEYAAKLFREVKESNPVREKYPLLFLTARAPGEPWQDCTVVPPSRSIACSAYGPISSRSTLTSASRHFLAIRARLPMFGAGALSLMASFLPVRR